MLVCGQISNLQLHDKAYVPAPGTVHLCNSNIQKCYRIFTLNVTVNGNV